MGRQMLRDWVNRYNRYGAPGLISRRGPRRPVSMTPVRKAELLDIVRAGPDPEVHGVVRWRCVDLKADVLKRVGVDVSEITIGRMAAWAEVHASPAALHAAANGNPLEIWFQDEARVGYKGADAYIWASTGTRPLMVRNNRHVSTYIFGAIGPDRGVSAVIIIPYANTEAMNAHLVEISVQVAPGAHAIVVCDGTG